MKYEERLSPTSFAESSTGLLHKLTPERDAMLVCLFEGYQVLPPLSTGLLHKLTPKHTTVLVRLFEGDASDVCVFLTKPSSRLSTHSGKVSLPGGKAEEGNKVDADTNTREAKEEIGLDPSLVNVVTHLQPFLSKPKILVDGPHDIHKCAEVSERVLAACYKALNDHKVLLEGTLLKANMVTARSESKKVAPEVIAEYTVHTLNPERTVPSVVPAIVFLSGGQSEEEATLNFNAMNQLMTKKSWSLSLSFQSTLKTWQGKEENIEKPRAAFLARCKAKSKATLGTYKGGMKQRLKVPLRASM